MTGATAKHEPEDGLHVYAEESLKRPVWLRLLAAAAAALGIVSPGAASACDPGFRAFEHAYGQSCIPEVPRAIIALRGDVLVTPLLEIGAPVVGGQVDIAGDGTLYVRGANEVFGRSFVQKFDLTSTGRPFQHDLEAIAAAEPDLILAMSSDAENYERLQLIAPTVVFPAHVPLLEHLRAVADAAGRLPQHEVMLSEYQESIRAARAVLGETDAIAVSRLDVGEDGLWFTPDWGAIDQVLRDLAFDRPDVQTDVNRIVSGMSLERITELDADVILSSYSSRAGQTIPMMEAQFDRLAPFWRNLSGVRAGQHFWYPRDVWNGASFAALDQVTEALELIIAGRLTP